MKTLALSVLTLGIVTAFSFAKTNDSFLQTRAENGESRVSLSCNNDLVQSYSYDASASLVAYEEIRTLSLQIHFDCDVLSVNSVSDKGSATIFDSSISADAISCSCIFGDIELESAISLFSFSFTVDSSAKPGAHYFDVIISEAYDSSMDSVEVASSRTYFNVKEKQAQKSTHFYTNANTINSSAGQTFSITYYLASLDPANGVFIIRYDDELFNFVSLNMGGFFSDALFDRNTNATGEVLISFVMYSPAAQNNLLTIEFEVKENISKASEITISASELYDNDQLPMTCGPHATTVSLSFDPTFEVLPRLYSTYQLDTINKKIVLTLHLDANSRLGAGDFSLSFNKEIVNYVSYTKLFSPTFFLVNDKAQQLEQGLVKFSIISTSDIVSETEVISFTFSYDESSLEQNAVFGLTGSGLTDSLTDPISLGIEGISCLIPATDFILRWSKVYLYMDDESFQGEGSGRCVSDGLYVIAKEELLKLDQYSIDSFINDSEGHYVAERGRYMAWAQAAGDSSPFAGDGIVAGAMAIEAKPITSNGAFLALIMCGSVLTTILLVYFKKRKKTTR